ncbi:MAG: NADPH:quinone reductase [Methylobacteriaceae bacterium]|nr:NADPH:quinone reductase [Methylobacteriaceae bacterium]
MRAVFYERCGPAAEVLRLGATPSPAPGPNEALVRVHVSGVNPHDVKKRAGWLTQELPAPRVIPHSDGAGVIVEAGPGVARERIGERVWIMHASDQRPGAGAAADLVVVHCDHAVRLPEGVGFDVGACLGVPFLTAHDAVLRDGPVTGQTVLVQGGAGAVAGYAIQLCVWNGARVIATVSSPQKAAHARALGADMTIDYTREDVVAAVMEQTRGRGVDRIVEVDFGANLVADHAVIRPCGVVASYSSSRVREPTLPYYAFARKGVTLHFVQGMLLTHERAGAGIRDATALLERGRLVHPIARTFPLAETAAAHELQEGGVAIGKILVANDL